MDELIIIFACMFLAIIIIMLIIDVFIRIIKVITKAVQKRNNKQHHLSEDILRRIWMLNDLPLDYDYLGLWPSSPLDKTTVVEPDPKPQLKAPICEMSEDGQLIFRNDVFKDLTIETERLIDEDDSKY